MTQYEQFTAMLDSSGVGYGIRHDFDPDSTAVQVECDDSDDAKQWTVVEFVFHADGDLKTVVCYEEQK